MLERSENVRLNSLTLRNFKGIRDLSLDLRGRDVSIHGDNGTGKTTVADGFSWLLFGKDSKDSANFEIKTLDAENRAIPGLDHEVEAELDLGGGAITLKKSYKEVWTKRRGEAKKAFTGHTTDHFIDGVPVQKKEYNARIAEIADEGIFKLLTNPRHFNDQLHWQDRRSLLLEVCGDVSDADVIKSDKALAALPEILGKRSMDDHRKVIAARRTEINRELDKIPVRIDEATRALPELPKDPRDAFINAITINEELKKGAEERRLRLESGGEIAEKKKALAELETDLLQVKSDLWIDIDAGIKVEQGLIRQLQHETDTLRSEIRQLERDAAYRAEAIEGTEKSMADARRDWADVNARAFEHEESDTCPTCGQALPAEQVETAREKALADFNTKRAGDLEVITAAGKRMKAQAEEGKAELADIEKKTTTAKADLEGAEADKAKAEERLAKLEKQAAEIEVSPAYQEKLEGRNILLGAIEALQAGSGQELEQVEKEIAALDERIADARAEIAKFDARKAGEARIKELEAEERSLAAELEGLEEELFLCEEFTRAKVRLLDEKINSRFKLARFKLFNVLVNGGLEECCETLYGGVPWSTGLNSGAQINVGIDIINTLSEHYGFTAPIFADNAESVTEIIPTPAQLIRLVVSGEDKALRIEYEEGNRE